MGLVTHTSYDVLVSPPILYGLPALYVVVAIAGNFAMRGRKAFEVGFAMKLYNVAQIVLCLYMSVGMFPSLGFPNVFGINGPYTEVAHATRIPAPRCRRNVPRAQLQHTIRLRGAHRAWQAGEWFVLVHYLSKFMDWFDTLWMILKKKSHVQMSFLHLYHHGVGPLGRGSVGRG